MYNSINSEVEQPLEYSNRSVGIKSESAEHSKCSGSIEATEQLICAETKKSMSRSKSSKVKRSLEDLNLMDSFLFSASTEKPKDAEVIARIVVERATGRKLGKVIIETEKQLLGIDTEHRGVRFDICITEFDDERIACVYDIEPNNYDLTSLPKRDRYNLSVSDTKLLSSRADFKQLPEYISIWILPNDPFGADRMIYTVKNMVVENNEIVYNDGVMRLFLNTRGTKGGTESLKALLNYFSNSCDANVVDSELEKLHNIVTDVKRSREVGERYMTVQEYFDYEIQAGIKEGIEIALEELREGIRDEVCKEVRDKVRGEVWEEVRGEVWEEVRGEVREEVRGEVREEVRQSERSEGILILIRNSINLGATKEKIVNILMKDYSLTEEDAKVRVNAEWCE